MNVHRHHDGVEYLDRGDYIEVLNSKKPTCKWLYTTRKGRYFINKGKRCYVKEGNNGKA